MSRYQAYPEYKESGVEWINDIPTHWNVTRLKRVISKLESGVSVNAFDTPAHEDEVGVLKTSCVYTRSFRPFENKTVVLDELSRVKCPVKKGAIIVSRMNTPDLVGASALVNSDVKNLYLPDRLWQIIFRKNFKISPEFVAYFMMIPNFRAQVSLAAEGASSSMQNIAKEDYLAIHFAQPVSYEEQCEVVAFLDHETAKIDALIEKQQRLIELLKEKRQAVISHAVTKGLNPNAPMKDSGVEWLGQVPAHWIVAPLKHLCLLLKDGTHLPPPRVDEGIPLLSVRNIVHGQFVLREDDSLISQFAFEALCRPFTPRVGDVLLAIVGATLGKVAIVKDMPPFHIQRSLAIFRTKTDFLSCEFLANVFSSIGFQSLLWENAGFSAQPGIYLGTLANFKIPIPPKNEQLVIDAYCNAKASKLDGLISKAESAISLMQERRTALISAAVTGKIDVRDWQAAA